MRNKEMRVLFVTPGLGYTDSVAIGYLSSIAKSRSHKTYYAHLDCSVDEWLLLCKNIAPDIIAYSVDTLGWGLVVERNNASKKILHYVSIAGGPHPTQCPEAFDDSGIDAFCVGEGEGAWEDFLVSIENEAGWADIPNIIAWKGSKKVINPVRPYVADLDSIPIPDRDLILGSTFLHKTGKKTFFTSRGCPFRCSYCQNDTWHELYKKKGRRVRRFSVERVIREMELVKDRHCMTFVKIDDDCFATSVDEWLEDFCREYKSRIGLPFNCLLRLDRIDEEMLSLLKSAGCYSVHLSVDSINPSLRARVLNRRYGDDDIIRKLRLFRKYGINIWVNFMLTLPGSTLWDDLGTIAFARKAMVTYSSYTTTVPTPGTALYRSAEADSLLPDGFENMTGELFYGLSVLNGFSSFRKRVSYNVFLFGDYLAKIPFPFRWVGYALLFLLPNLSISRKLRDFGFQNAVSNTIYKLERE